MNELVEAYMTMQFHCGIEVGDTVKVLRKAESNELGWGNAWTVSMYKKVGKSGTVIEVSDIGVKVDFKDDYWNFPFFVLEKIPKPHWRDTVSPENPVLCYVRDNNNGDWFGPMSVTRYDSSSGITYPYRVSHTGFSYAKRVPKSMIESMLKAYDETSEDE